MWTLQGILFDAYTKLPLAGATVQAVDPNTGQIIATAYSEHDGDWSLQAPDDTVLIYFYMNGYKSYLNVAKTVSYGYRMYMEPGTSETLQDILKQVSPGTPSPGTSAGGGILQKPWFWILVVGGAGIYAVRKGMIKMPKL